MTIAPTSSPAVRQPIRTSNNHADVTEVIDAVPVTDGQSWWIAAAADLVALLLLLSGLFFLIWSLIA
jgi:hypothetical protein